MQIAHILTDLIGNTPLLALERYAPGARILAKLECFNPLSSAKDRAALYMIRDAEARGLLRPGSVLVEPTSGNTGVGLSYIAALRGYRVILTMPETMSAERRSLLSALGAELVLTPGPAGMQGAIDKANELLATLPGAWMPAQFDNPANARAHYETTGPEIWRDTDGAVDIYVAGVGTGGTLTGAGRYLKEQNPAVRVVAVEPAESPVLSGGKAGPHKIQGIGANFIPSVLDRTVYDRVLPVSGNDAYQGTRELVRTEGLLCGVSSGAAAHAASGQPVSGDALDQFCDTGGRAQMLLCDGMGTGRAAAVDGQMAAKLTAQLLQAGFAAESAARLVNVALGLKNAGQESGATLDLLTLDLYTGRAGLFKAGAAPSFLCRAGVVRTLDGASLPMGVLPTVTGRSTALTLDVGDTVMMVSDGALCDGSAWLCDQLTLSTRLGQSPQQTAEAVAASAVRRSGARQDDITVAIVRLERQKS